MELCHRIAVQISLVGALGMNERLAGLRMMFGGDIVSLLELPDCGVWVNGMDVITGSCCWDGCSCWWLGGMQSRLCLGRNGVLWGLFRRYLLVVLLCLWVTGKDPACLEW